jgi:hypothetical protein
MGEEFDFNNILGEDEINALFDEDITLNNEDSKEDSKQEDSKEVQTQESKTTEVEIDDLFQSESVGSEENIQEKEDTTSDKGGTSPNNFYSSIAKALKEDGILPDLDDEVLNNTSTAEQFAELIESQIKSRFDERQKRIDEALGLNVDTTIIQQYEKTLSFLDSITSELISDESEKGENLRKQLIYQDFINRGYNKERALREVSKSFNAGSDIDDAKEALLSNKEFFSESYNNLINEEKQKENALVEKRKKEAENLKTSILEDDKVFGELVVDKATRRKIYDNISKPVYKKEDGTYLTTIQKYELDNPVEFRKYVSLVYTLTDGFKNLNGLVKNKVNSEMKKGLKNLEATLKNSHSSDGSLQFVTGYRNSRSADINSGWVPDV